MDESGFVVDKEDATGCKLTHKLVCLQICIVIDEVGGNTSQKGNGKNGGELKVCATDMIPQQKISIEDKH